MLDTNLWRPEGDFRLYDVRDGGLTQIWRSRPPRFVDRTLWESTEGSRAAVGFWRVGDENSSWCTVTDIGENKVITAGHCLQADGGAEGMIHWPDGTQNKILRVLEGGPDGPWAEFAFEGTRSSPQSLGLSSWHRGNFGILHYGLFSSDVPPPPEPVYQFTGVCDRRSGIELNYDCDTNKCASGAPIVEAGPGGTAVVIGLHLNDSHGVFVDTLRRRDGGMLLMP